MPNNALWDINIDQYQAKQDSAFHNITHSFLSIPQINTQNCIDDDLHPVPNLGNGSCLNVEIKNITQTGQNCLSMLVLANQSVIMLVFLAQ